MAAALNARTNPWIILSIFQSSKKILYETALNELISIRWNSLYSIDNLDLDDLLLSFINFPFVAFPKELDELFSLNSDPNTPPYSRTQLKNDYCCYIFDLTKKICFLSLPIHTVQREEKKSWKDSTNIIIIIPTSTISMY